MKFMFRDYAFLSIYFIATAEPALTQDILTPDDARLHGLESLRKQVEIDGGPPLPDLTGIVAHGGLVRALGKAFFFDMAAGSDGIQACATCHFHAGADNRATNQVSPGLLRREATREGEIVGYFNAAAAADTTFQTRAPNQTLTASDFPLVKDIGDGDSACSHSNDAISSQGVISTVFKAVHPDSLVDVGNLQPDPIFNASAHNTRRVEPRNTPTVINAVFFYDNFWDGRAKFCFNGVDPFGNQNPDAKVFHATEDGIEVVSLSLERSSLASQAVGPPLSDFEMSWAGRDFKDLARKLIPRLGLAEQQVHYRDSLLRILRHPSGMGLKFSYEELIRWAFDSSWWNSPYHIYFPESGAPEVVDPGTTDPDRTYTLMEANFSMFWGISIMLFESLLVSDSSPFDRWMETGHFLNGFGPFQRAGLNVFAGKGKCINCHGGPEFTGASVRNAQNTNNILEFMVMGNREPAIYDNGFYNIGVTPTADDIARGGADPFGNPLASSRQILFHANGIQSIDFQIKGLPAQGLEASPTDLQILGVRDEDTGEFIEVCRDLDGDGLCGKDDGWITARNAVDGSFKTPSLRNQALMGPYMHNGGLATLREVVDFYDRGGNFCKTNIDDLDPDITQLGLTVREKNQLIAFLVSLTDSRVARRSDQFDGPQIWIPIGHLPTGETLLQEVVATGATGLPMGGQIGTFLRLNPFHGNPVQGLCSPDPPEGVASQVSSSGHIARK